MTWQGTKFFNIKTNKFGVCSFFESSGVTACLSIKYDDDQKEEDIFMNNISYGREFEISTNEKYKHLFWENPKGSGNFKPLADTNFVKDPKQLWIEWCALDDTLTSKRLLEELEFLSKISKEEWLKS